MDMSMDLGTGYRLIKSARDAILGVCMVVLVAAPVVAQTPPALGDSPAAPERQSTMIGGNPPSTTTLERCVDVQIGGENAFSCLNQRLKREVDRTNPSIATPPLDARSPDVRVGNVNEAAVREQYGSNYGRSAIPFRPPVQAFVPHR